MKEMKLVATLVGLFVGFLYCCFTYGVKEIKHAKDFYDKVDREPFSVVMLYKEIKKNISWHNNLKLQKKNFHTVSTSGLYRNGDVQFLELNIEKNNLKEVADQYAIGQVPAFILFVNGKAVTTQEKRMALLTGFSKQSDIRSFINKHLRNKIETYIEQQAEWKAQERERREASATMFTFGAGVGVPYFPAYDPWNYGYGNPYGYGPTVGFGVSVGF